MRRDASWRLLLPAQMSTKPDQAQCSVATAYWDPYRVDGSRGSQCRHGSVIRKYSSQREFAASSQAGDASWLWRRGDAFRGDDGARMGRCPSHKRQLCVQHSDWKGQVTTTKGGRLRHVPMTERLAAALKSHRHLRGKRVLVQPSGEPLTMKIVQDRIARAARRAGVRPGVHIRHTFCSHLAMRGAPARAIPNWPGTRT